MPYRTHFDRSDSTWSDRCTVYLRALRPDLKPEALHLCVALLANSMTRYSAGRAATLCSEIVPARYFLD